MKYLSLFVLSLAAIFTSCKKDSYEDYSAQRCTSGCAVVEGQLTSGGKPVPGITMELQSIKSSGDLPYGVSIHTRKIARAVTDASGHYSLNFGMGVDFGPGNESPSFILIIGIPDFLTYYRFGSSSYAYSVTLPETPAERKTIKQDINLVKTQHVAVKLYSNMLSRQGDYFKVGSVFRQGGEKNAEWIKPPYYWHNFKIAVPFYEMEVSTSGDDSTYIRIEKMKDSVLTAIDTVIMTPADQPPPVWTFTF